MQLKQLQDFNLTSFDLMMLQMSFTSYKKLDTLLDGLFAHRSKGDALDKHLDYPRNFQHPCIFNGSENLLQRQVTKCQFKQLLSRLWILWPHMSGFSAQIIGVVPGKLS